MDVSFEFSNCDQENRWLYEPEANSSVTLRIELSELISLQSSKQRRAVLTDGLRNALRDFRWLALGPIYVNMGWYLDSVARQETDKHADLDNLVKPMLDSLLGIDGLFVDDSQIKSLDVSWIAKNRSIRASILRMEIRFINDYSLLKKDLYFIQYDGPMCFAINAGSRLDRFVAASVRRFRSRMRSAAKRTKALGFDMDGHYVVDPFEFHRSRLGHIPADRILDRRK